MNKLYLPLHNGTERCFYIDTDRPLRPDEEEKLSWLLAGPTRKDDLTQTSALSGNVLEVGPRIEIETPASSQIVSICRDIGLPVNRLEESRREKIPNGTSLEVFARHRFDPLVQAIYKQPLTTLKTRKRPEPVRIMRLGKRPLQALERISTTLGLGWDKWDLEFVLVLVTTVLKRDPTDVELFQLAQMNSEHCRHWFFKGIMVLNGVEMEESLLDLIRMPLREREKQRKTNSIAAFCDNSSGILGFRVPYPAPKHPGEMSEIVTLVGLIHLIWTVETHNHPTAVYPFAGAATGIGGAIRDIQMMIRAAMAAFAMSGYSVGSLNLKGFKIPGERRYKLSPRFASPHRVLIEGSDGSARYGNEFGITTLLGTVRTFDMKVGGERIGYIKPILLAGVGGFMTDAHRKKEVPKKGMIVVQVGPPQYPVGVGGGSASSMGAGQNTLELDLASVQRGNAAEERVMDEFVYTCAMLGRRNPIRSAHDQGAGGPCNVLTEIVSPAGARLYIRRIKAGSSTMGVLKIWCAEAQERNAVLTTKRDLPRLRAIARREGLSVEVIGYVTGNGKVTLIDTDKDAKVRIPVDLPLGPILERVPRKRFIDNEVERTLQPFVPPNKAIREFVEQVFRIPGVASKLWLLRKKDRSVGGRVARQQCCGPFQLPVCDVAAVTLSLESLEAMAVALGEQPTKGIIDPEACARLSGAEALTNIMWALIDGGLPNLKSSVNWMAAAKQPGGAVWMYRAAKALVKFIVALGGMEPDGGKDSLTLLAKVGRTIVKSPNTVMVSAYGSVADGRRIITPNLKMAGYSRLGFLDLSGGYQRLGGSALAQSCAAIGNESPDAAPTLLKDGFNAIQLLIKKGLILSGHDRSDGGLITLLAEMAMAGGIGAKVAFPAWQDPVRFLFNEEPGAVIEYTPDASKFVHHVFDDLGLQGAFTEIGETMPDPAFSVSFGEERVMEEDLATLRNWWEAVSDRLEEEQMNKKLARQMARSPWRHVPPKWKLTFTPTTPRPRIRTSPKVAILRVKGSNGHREMQAAFKYVGFKTFDVHMYDIIKGTADIDRFRGIVPVGGFSYGDVLGSGRGWAALIKYNERVRGKFESFFRRSDTFSLSVCNGCQMTALLDIILGRDYEGCQPYLEHNLSGKFEAGMAHVLVEKSPSIMLRSMAGSVLGIQYAHGEGRFAFRTGAALNLVESMGLVALRYTLPDGTPTEEYPFNPNGSPNGIAGVTSLNGRHLILMPHFERLTRPIVWPWMPTEFQKLEFSPWIQPFVSARDWCEGRE